MNKKVFWICILLVTALTLGACGGKATPTAQSQVAENPVETVEVPAEYRDLTNPVGTEPQAAEAGKTVYATYCSACHGELGAGDGPASSGLNPAPKNLAANEDSLSDGYLFWRISQGGLSEPFNSTMPAWENVITETEIWQVVTYLRTMGE